MDLGIPGKRAVVAAASQGIGFAIARELASEGARVAICSRDAHRAETAADQIRAYTRSEVLSAEVDVSDLAQVRTWLDAVASDWGGLDIVIPNAGGPRSGTFADSDPEGWDAAYRLTLRSALGFAKYARPHLASGSSMLFMTSASVREPVGSLALSTVFRAGVAALAKTLSDEWAGDGIRVNHLIPGRIATERVAALDAYVAEKEGVTAAEVRSRSQAAIPLGRYGDLEEFAAAAVFLVSDVASYITGATLQVDGGMIRAIS
jgi:3-oxoacyl-[acyl-carrier protein] reductase